MQLAMDYGKVVARQKWPAQPEDKRAAQEKATQQPAGTMKGQEGGATRGRREMMQQPAGMMRRREGITTRRRDNETTRQREGGALRGDATTSRRDERYKDEWAAQRERTRRGNATTNWHDERTRGWRNERTARGDVTFS
jgi:hypothetical protein